MDPARLRPNVLVCRRSGRSLHPSGTEPQGPDLREDDMTDAGDVPVVDDFRDAGSHEAVCVALIGSISAGSSTAAPR
jgi:hypothetical protein